MPTADEISRWQARRLEAWIWCCDPEDCCESIQARIDRIEPNAEAGFPWIRRADIWRGTFLVDPDFKVAESELRDASKLFGIPLDQNCVGECVAPPAD